jgi:hypothetical protein
MIPGRMFERGRRGEFLVARLLQSRGWGVVPCYDYSGSDGKKAPRLMFERRALPIPDLDVVKCGKRCWVEVKVKARPDFTRITQTWDHGIPLRLLVSYRWVERESGCLVWLFIVEEKNRIIRYSALSALGDPRIWCGQDMDSHGMAFWPIDNFRYCWDIPEQEFIKLNEAV